MELARVVARLAERWRRAAAGCSADVVRPRSRDKHDERLLRWVSEEPQRRRHVARTGLGRPEVDRGQRLLAEQVVLPEERHVVALLLEQAEEVGLPRLDQVLRQTQTESGGSGKEPESLRA